jgi:ribonuclease HI
MEKLILYTDGGCSGNEQRDMNKRQMIACVSDQRGNILVEKKETGGSNNIAELLAVKEAVMYAIMHKHEDVEIRTDSKNNLAWVFGKVGKKMNDRDAVLNLKTVIDTARASLKHFDLTWVPRDENRAGIYLEAKYSL